jgi:hypothetical protein
MKDLREMAIGRTDDPEIPLKPVALEAAGLFGTGSRTPSGPAVMAPRRQGRTHDRSRTAVKILFEVLEPTGSSTHGISANQGMAKLSLAPHMPNMMANATTPAAVAPPIRKRSA